MRGELPKEIAVQKFSMFAGFAVMLTAAAASSLGLMSILM